MTRPGPASAEFGCPTDNVGRTATIMAVGTGLGIGAGWLLAEHHVGALSPRSSTTTRPRVVSLGGRF